jgi:hypothetical protein
MSDYLSSIEVERDSQKQKDVTDQEQPVKLHGEIKVNMLEHGTCSLFDHD